MSALLADLVRSGRAWRGNERAQIAAEATAHAALDSVLPGGGWPVGGLSEIVYSRDGVGELRLVLPLLGRLTQAGRHVALVAPPQIPYAPALVAGGVRLSHLLVVDAPETDLFWAAEQLLHSRTGAVLVWARRADTQALRRLQLAAEDAHGIVFLFHGGNLCNFSPAALRLRANRAEAATQVEILKCRGGAIGQRVALG